MLWKNVYRNCLKLFQPIIGFREVSGEKFQTDGPATPHRKPVGHRSWAGDAVRKLSGGGSEMFPWCDTCDWSAQFHEVRRRWTLNLTIHQASRLANDRVICPSDGQMDGPEIIYGRYNLLDGQTTAESVAYGDGMLSRNSEHWNSDTEP